MHTLLQTHACSLTHADKHTHKHTHTHTEELMHKHRLSPAAIGYIAMHTKKTGIEEGKREMDETSEGWSEGWMDEREGGGQG